MRKHLTALRLTVADPGELSQFYVDILGMTQSETGEGVRLGYPGEDADLLLMPGGSSYAHSGRHRYWKIGIGVPDLDLAHAQLVAQGVAVSQPRQFLDIGYMAHLSDPAGFVIELLQHDFEGLHPPGDPDLPLGGGAHLGQITLRTGDIQADLEQYAEMSLLSVQPVPSYGFDLYFLAYTNDSPPSPDLKAVENRPWLWRRPYTTLEFQHIPGAEIEQDDAYGGLEITG